LRRLLQIGSLPLFRITTCSFLLVACSLKLEAQLSSPLEAQDYWQQEVHYDLTVTLNDHDHSLNGFEKIEYSNHSPDTLSFLWFHLWPNAYKDNNTAFYQQKAFLEDRSSSRPERIKDNGYIDHLSFMVNGTKVFTEADPHDRIDIIRIPLPQKLAPGGRVTITTPFFLKIPPYFSRLGHAGQNYMITQWYPKPAVYDRKGWHEMPYLDQGEFYSEFGSFDVHITVPSSYVVAATGVLQTIPELEKYKSIGGKNYLHRSSALFQPILYQGGDPKGSKTLSYHAENVHDFAWFADKDLVISYDTLQLASGRTIDVFSYRRRTGNKEWKNGVTFIKDAVLHYSNWVGEYAYPSVSAVEGPGNTTSGGMEYPMITLITSPKAGASELDGVITHEVGHNWFYGMLGSNERIHPWMDEGINSYYEFRYEAEKYRTNSMLGSFVPEDALKKDPDEFLAAVYKIIDGIRTNYSIETAAADFNSEFEYGIVEYARAAEWMDLLAKAMGEGKFQKGMRAYFSRWKFKHPYPEDLKESLEESSHSSLDKWFRLLNRVGSFYGPAHGADESLFPDNK